MSDPKIPYWKQPVPSFNGKERWEACDAALFFLYAEGVITNSEEFKSRKRLVKLCLNDGVAIHENGAYYSNAALSKDSCRAARGGKA